MVRIGCGAGFGGDRLEPAVRLLEEGSLDYLVLECLAERTIGLGQKRRLHDPASGYDPLLERRLRPLQRLAAVQSREQRRQLGREFAARAGFGDDVLRNLGLAYIPTVVGLYGLAILCLMFFNINRARHDENLQTLAEGADRTLIIRPLRVAA